MTNPQSKYKFADFHLGQRVKIICAMQDFYFFYGETGRITKLQDSYLGISVTFDEPRQFEGGYTRTHFNFDPSDLIPIGPRIL